MEQKRGYAEDEMKLLEKETTDKISEGEEDRKIGEREREREREMVRSMKRKEGGLSQNHEFNHLTCPASFSTLVHTDIIIVVAIYRHNTDILLDHICAHSGDDSMTMSATK